jgi:hypothetical protein
MMLLIWIWIVRGVCLITMFSFVVCSCYMLTKLMVEVRNSVPKTRPEARIHLGTMQALEQAILDAKPIGVEYEFSFVESDAVPWGTVRITIEVPR